MAMVSNSCTAPRGIEHYTIGSHNKIKGFFSGIVYGIIIYCQGNICDIPLVAM